MNARLYAVLTICSLILLFGTGPGCATEFRTGNPVDLPSTGTISDDLMAGGNNVTVAGTVAGDLFAAGFLFGLVRNAGHENAGRLGALAAAEIIQHIGARPQASLRELAQQNGLPV